MTGDAAGDLGNGDLDAGDLDSGDLIGGDSAGAFNLAGLLDSTSSAAIDVPIDVP